MTEHAQLSWNLDHLYGSIDDLQIDRDFARIDEISEKIKTYRGRMASLNPSELYEFLKIGEERSELMQQIGLYAGLLESTNVGVAEITRFDKKIEEAMVRRATDTLFASVELARLPEEKWQEFLNSPELAEYRHFLELTYKEAQHTLTEPEEKILTEKSQTSNSALNHLYSITTNTLEVEWDGKTVTLEELLSKLRDPDASVRKQAALKLNSALETNTKTTPSILNALVQDKAISQRLRGYEYPEHARYLSEDVEKETVDTLVDVVSKSSGMVTRYYTLKKKILGVDELFWWDRYAPPPQTEAKIDIAQARAMVNDATQAFSPRLAEITQKMIEDRHIDWLPSKTKRGGAFCAYGTKTIYPYVLLNYTNDLRDVTTLAHELGHAVHDVLAAENNNTYQAHAPLPLAEIASTFGESLVLEQLLNSDIPKQDKIALLMSSIEDSFATIHRQIAMFQFEQQLHRKRQEEGELSKEQLDELWHTVMKAPFEGALTYTNEHKNSWMYVSHIFASPFYVFTYAYAQLCTLALVKQYRDAREAGENEQEKFAAQYLKILKAGGSLSPKDNLARAGLDVTTAEFWQNGLDMVNDTITELEELI